MMVIVQCSHVVVEDLYIQNSSAWNLNPMFSSDLIYDVLARYQPDHILMRATRQDAARGLTDIRRLGDLLARFQGKIDFRELERVSPMAMPLMLEVGREPVTASAVEDSLAELEADLLNEAMDGLDVNTPFQASLGV